MEYVLMILAAIFVPAFIIAIYRQIKQVLFVRKAKAKAGADANWWQLLTERLDALIGSAEERLAAIDGERDELHPTKGCDPYHELGKRKGQVEYVVASFGYIRDVCRAGDAAGLGSGHPSSWMFYLQADDVEGAAYTYELSSLVEKVQRFQRHHELSPLTADA